MKKFIIDTKIEKKEKRHLKLARKFKKEKKKKIQNWHEILKKKRNSKVARKFKKKKKIQNVCKNFKEKKLARKIQKKVKILSRKSTKF